LRRPELRERRRGAVSAAPNLDRIDQRLIEALQQNGREPFRRIAAEVGVSEATIRARYQKLCEDNILQVTGVTNPLGLGFDAQAMVGIRTSGSPEPVAEAIAQWDEADYVVITAGTYDLFFSGWAHMPHDPDWYFGQWFTKAGSEKLTRYNNPRVEQLIAEGRVPDPKVRQAKYEELERILWDEEPPPTATKALQVQISQLRRALGAQTIITRSSGYAIQAGELRYIRIANSNWNRLTGFRPGKVRSCQYCILPCSQRRSRRLNSRSVGGLSSKLNPSSGSTRTS